MFNLGYLILLIFHLMLFNISESHYQIKYGSDAIPKYLWDCYKSGLKTLPMTDKIFIDIIRKIEKNSYFSLDIRLLTNSMLHRFWRDGIEQDPKRNEVLDGILPFGPSGFQANKYKLLIEKLIPGSAYFFPNDSITLEEQCTLHFMLSSSVWAWERGDESQVCPESSTEQKQRNYFTTTGSKRSSCPIEKGVIRVQKDGITSLSHVIAAIATTLAPLQIKQLYISEGNGTYGDSIIDNRWAATLAGDLAEIIIIQSPHTNNLFLGPGGKWNDTSIPKEYYMIANDKFIENGFWQCTDAELFGSLDGLAISEEVSRWLNIFHTLKLSQILELYYTHYGAYFQIQNRACNRRSYYINSLINQKKTVTEQALYFAEVLATITPHVVLDDDYIFKRSQQSFNSFTNYMTPLLKDSGNCEEVSSLPSRLNLIVIFDSTWTQYKRKQLMMSIAEDNDISIFGSTISIISGNAGECIVRKANSSVELFLQWENATDSLKDTTNLNLAESFLSIKKLLQWNSTRKDLSMYKHSKGFATLILGLSSSLSNREINNSLSVLRNIRAIIPEMQFIYITSEAHSPSFKILATSPGSQNDEVLTLSNTDINDVRKNIKNSLSLIPRSLRASNCGNTSRSLRNVTYEEYLIPSLTYSYIIHPNYLCDSDRVITIKIQNSDYGNIRVCISRDPSEKENNCTEASIMQEMDFKVSNPCSKDYVLGNNWDPHCMPIFLTLVGQRSLNKCSESDCRMPNQIRLNIIINGLKCIKDNFVTCSGNSINHFGRFWIVLVMYIMYFQDERNYSIET